MMDDDESNKCLLCETVGCASNKTNFGRIVNILSKGIQNFFINCITCYLIIVTHQDILNSFLIFYASSIKIKGC